MKKIEDDIKNNKKIKKYDNSYLGSSVLLSLPYLDIVRCIRFDFMHLVSNVIKSLFQFMTNSKPMVFNDDRRKMEKLLGRTWDTKDVAPFHISNDFQKLFSQIHGDLKLPLIENDYGRKRDIFSHERMRSSDYAFYASGYGIWIINNSNIEEPYKGIICRLIACASLLRMKSYDKSILPDIDKFIIESLTLAETLLPYYIFGINFHLLIHTFAPEGGIIELGPAISHHTFDQERMGGQLSKFATSYKNPIATIKNHYLLSRDIKFNDLKNEAKLDDYICDYNSMVILGDVTKTGILSANIAHLLPPYTKIKKLSDMSGKFYNTIVWKGVKFNTSEMVEYSHVHDNSVVKILVDSRKNLYEYGTIKDIFIPDSHTDHILICVKWLIIVPFDEYSQVPDSKTKTNSRKRKKKTDEKKIMIIY